MWPEYFPAQCPPNDARRDEIRVFRLVTNSMPSAYDFLPTKVEFPHRQFDEHELCMACGVSVFKQFSCAQKVRSRYKGLKGKKIASGEIKLTDGLIKETGKPTHITWWLQTIDPQLSFREVVADVTE